MFVKWSALAIVAWSVAERGARMARRAWRRLIMLMRLTIGALVGICAWGMSAAPAAAQCNWEQVETLLPGGPPERDRFGTSVAVAGTTAIIGAPYDSEKGEVAGAAYIFELDGGEWTQVAKLTADDASEKANFGRSVAISGDTAVVGAYGDRSRAGAAYVFDRVAGMWTQVAAIRASDGRADADFGWSVSISGDVIVVGAPHADAVASSSGAAYVFERAGGVWMEEARLVAADGRSFDLLGTSVAVDGDTAIAGAPTQSHTRPAYVFEKVEGEWKQVRALHGDSLATLFGTSVSVNGGVALIAAPYEEAGAVYVFDRDGGAWNRSAKLLASDSPSGQSRFGISTALVGDLAVVGGSRTPGAAPRSGSAYLYQNVGGSWDEIGKVAAIGGMPDSEFGLSVATDGSTVLAGAPWFDPHREPGAVYVFEEVCGCYADCDGDGEVTFSDFLCFQDEFAAGDGGADCDGDFALTFFDFLCFQDTFAAGCP
jgi:hypothetical protein